jgi:hypothetical protein
MAYPIYANDIGGIGVALANQNAQRDASSRAAMANLMIGLGRMQQQQNFQQQQVMAERNRTQALLQNLMALRQDQDYRNRALNLDESYRKWQMEQPSKSDLTTARETLKNKTSGLHDLVENRLPINWAEFADVPPDILNPLRETDQALRAKEVAELKIAEDAATAGRRLRIIQQKADELEKSPTTPTGSNFLDFSGRTYPAQQPKEVAKTMRERMAPLKLRYAPFLDPKEGYVMPDPATGDYTVHPSLIKPWMVGTNRQIQLAPATDTNTAAPAAPTNVPLITAPPPPMTGTNQPRLPRFQKQGGVWFELQPDGSYKAVVKG